MHYEQPDIHFKHEMITQFGTESGGSLFWSTFARVNALNGALVSRVPAVTASEVDGNRDGIQDKFRIRISMPLTPGDSVTLARAALFFQCDLSRRAVVQMEGAVFIDVPVPSGATGLKMFGRFQVRQSQPFVLDSSPRVVYNESAVGNATDISSVSLASLVSEFSSRNESLELYPMHVVWDFAPAKGGASVFVIDAELTSGAQRVLYRPSFAETMKFAWVQYISVFWIIWAFVFVSRRFVLGGRILPTWESTSKAKAL